MYRWRMAAVAAFVSSLGQAAVVVECDFRAPNRQSTLTMTEDAVQYVFKVSDTRGIGLAETLKLGRARDFVSVEIGFPKSDGLCGMAGTPTSELWCVTKTSYPMAFYDRTGAGMMVTLETPGLDLAILGGDVPRGVAYRLFGARPVDSFTVISGAQNGSFEGPVCHR